MLVPYHRITYEKGAVGGQRRSEGRSIFAAACICFSLFVVALSFVGRLAWVALGGWLGGWAVSPHHHYRRNRGWPGVRMGWRVDVLFLLFVACPSRYLVYVCVWLGREGRGGGGLQTFIPFAACSRAPLEMIIKPSPVEWVEKYVSVRSAGEGEAE